MKSRLMISIAAAVGAAACVSIIAYAAGTGSTPAKGQTPAGSAAPAAKDTARGAMTGTGGQGAAMKLSDPEILGVGLAVDSNEIAAAKAAEKKKMRKEAGAYAKMLLDMHTMDVDKTKKLGKKLGMAPASSMKSQEIRAKGAAMLETLSPKSGEEFEKAYIDDMVTGHAEALQMIDTELMPNAQNEAVKKHLTEMRAMVSAHLEQGKRLQSASASSQGQ